MVVSIKIEFVEGGWGLNKEWFYCYLIYVVFFLSKFLLLDLSVVLIKKLFYGKNKKFVVCLVIKKCLYRNKVLYSYIRKKWRWYFEYELYYVLLNLGLLLK